MKKYLILIFAMTFLSVNVQAKPTLLYHQNSEAKRVKGSVDELRQAIREGKTIRIYMNLGFVEHLMDAGFMSIIGNNVYAQIDGIQAQRPDRKAHTITLRPYARHVGFYSTLSPYEMKWYAVDKHSHFSKKNEAIRYEHWNAPMNLMRRRTRHCLIHV